MKILIFLTKWKGGVGVVVKSIKKELEKRGHTVIAISREDELRKFSSVKNLFWLRNKYKEIVKKENPDIIYTQDWSMALPLLFPSKIYKKKHFTCFHGSNEGISKLFQSWVAKSMRDRLILVSTLNKNRYPWGKLIPNAVDVNFFRPLKKKRKYIGWIDKDSEEITKKYFLILAKKLKMEPLVAENIPHDNMNDFYNNCNVFLSLPPTYAGCALSWLEAMSAGVPKIIGNAYGDGNLLPIDKVDGINNNVLNTIIHSKNKNYRDWLIKNGRTWENHVKRLLKRWEIFE